jgi:pectate lyase-like protein/parallel beta helix pectate lyase-like protein
MLVFCDPPLLVRRKNMRNHDKSFGRRELARGVLIGGAPLLLSAAAWAGAEEPSGRGLLNAREFGAAGDGKTNDTKALQRALDAAGEMHGAVFVPPGVYLTGELHMRPDTALVGIPAWDYRGPGGTVLRLANGESACLLNITEAWGATIESLALDGGGLGKNVHGIFLNKPDYGKHEDAFRIERCQVARFSGDGMNLTRAWCFSVRHSMLAYNRGDGLSLRGWDGFLVDNWFSGNKRAGFGARFENASVTFTANRVEWNGEENLLITGGDGYQITGNFFDRAGTCAIALRSGRAPCSQMTVTGNFLKRSGKLANPESHESSQILLEGARGVTCVGNNLQVWQDDNGTGVFSPSYGIVYKGLQDCVISNNVLYEGAVRQLLVDLGGHGEGVIVKDNPGRLFRRNH